MSTIFLLEIWREYVGYDIDLNLPSILAAPNLASNDNNYDMLLDGNMTTCVQLPHVSCGFGFKVCYRLPIKLWQGIVFSSICLSVHRLDPQMIAADPFKLIHLEILPT